METTKLFYALITSLFLLGKASAQADNYFDGTDLTSLQDDALLPVASAKKVMAIYEANKHRIPSMKDYRDFPKTTSLPANFEDIYFSNNWLQVSSYWYIDDLAQNEEMNDFFDEFLWVTSRDKGTAELQYRHRYIPGRPDPEIAYYENFNGNLERIKKVGNYYYRHTKYARPGAGENYSVIVSYDDGILILENSYTGKVGDFTSKRRFRNVYLAIPKAMGSSQTNDPVVTHNSDPYVNPATPASTQNDSYYPVQPVLSFRENSYINGMAANNLRDNFFLELANIPQSEALRNMRPGRPITPNLEYDLYDFDWMEVARFEWYNGERYVLNSLSSEMLRFHPQAGTYRFDLQHPGETMDAKLRFLDNWEKQVTKVQRQGQYTYLSLGNLPVRTVVSYENNMLVMDERDPVSGSVFRMVYQAVPKQF